MYRSVLAAALLLARLLEAAGVVVRFDPASPEVGPFPSDALTVADPAQQTGLRVNLPLPDCRVQVSACRETELLNRLDGFSIVPRVRVRFSAPIDPETIRQGVGLVLLDGPGAGRATGINQVVYDPAGDTAYAEPDRPLAAAARYALLVTSAVRDRAGDPVGPDPAFLRCLAGGTGYCGSLSRLLPITDARLPPRARARPRRVVAASLFTTASAASWLEKARAALQASPLGVAPAGPRAVLKVDDLLALTLRLQERAAPPGFSEFTLPVPQVLLAGVSRIAFGSFHSPSFLDEAQMIPPAASGGSVALPPASAEILFHVFLPAAPRPPGGYPVVVFGHGLNDSRFGAPTLVASTFARAGFATLAINAVGHGSGPLSALRVTLNTGERFDIPAGGRSLDRNGDGIIESAEGCIISTPAPVGLRDCLRQTALDLTQLVRAVRAGLDLDGDGAVDLDADRIYYAGQSLGALYGTLLAAVEPAIRAAVLNVGGGTVMDIARWSPEFRDFARDYLQSRVPPLLNRPGDYNENYVLRDQPVRVNDVPGAVEIQNAFEALEWLQISGDPLSFAGRLRAPVLWQFARGDRTVPNPQTSALIRAAGANLENVQLYRHDLARLTFSDLAANPHAYLVDLRSLPAISIALAAQSQIAGFFASDGSSVPGANSAQIRILFGRNLFETPAVLPEELGF